MKLFPFGHATHPQWPMAAGLVLAQLRAQMALPDYANAPTLGLLELAPLLGLADAIVDLVETGSTLKENGLEIVEEVAPVSARMIVNVASMKMKGQEILPLAKQLEQAVKEATVK